MRRLFQWAAKGGWVVLVLLAAQASASERIALVIGNSNYNHSTLLPNPKNDAEDVSELLRQLDFLVIKGIDLDRVSTEATIRQFAEASAKAKVVLFFYAGHGMQVAGRNYLIPIDARLEDRTALDFEAIDTDKIFQYMAGEGKLALAFLDACRNNPLARNFTQRADAVRAASVASGLAPTSTSGSGLFVAYATAPNDVALDGTGRNSPFTTALLRHLPTPNLEIQQVMTRVKAQVQTETAGRQRPWHNSDLGTEVFLAKSEQPAINYAPPPNPESYHDEAMSSLWNAARLSRDKTLVKHFLRRYPKGPYASLAEALLAELEKPDRLQNTDEGTPVTGEATSLTACRSYASVLGYGRSANREGVIRPEDILAACEQAARDNPQSGEAHWLLSLAYANLNDIERSDAELVRAYELGNIDALARFVDSLRNTYEPHPDTIIYNAVLAERLSHRLYEHRPYAGAYSLSQLFKYSDEVKDEPKARQWHERYLVELEAEAKRGDDHYAVYMYGIELLENGRATEAIRIFEDLHDQGETIGATTLALNVYGRHSKFRDDVLAARYRDEASAAYKREADRGSVSALFALGYSYLWADNFDSGKFHDVDTAIRWFEKAAAYGSPAAIDQLVAIYAGDPDGSRKDRERADYWRKQYVRETEKCSPYDVGILKLQDPEIVGLRSAEERLYCFVKARMGIGLINVSLDEFSRAMTAEQRVTFQRMLQDTGHYRGKLDGVLGRETVQAYNSYVQSR